MNIDFDKHPDGLVPAIVQDAGTRVVLMLGYMDRAAFTATETSGKVTFFSRSRQRLWTKGETSGNFLSVRDIKVDCDLDTILIQASPAGPVCHTGADTCFDESNSDRDFLHELETIIRSRKVEPDANSYTSKLLARGINKIAQKVGEEAVELIIEAKDQNIPLIKEEAADLMYHFLVLLAATDVRLDDVVEVLRLRRKV